MNNWFLNNEKEIGRDFQRQLIYSDVFLTSGKKKENVSPFLFPAGGGCNKWRLVKVKKESNFNLQACFYCFIVLT